MSQPTREHFRARTSAAPLKHRARQRRVALAAHFRARTSAAPLKLMLDYTISFPLPGFPRSHERGPIEATARRKRSRSAAMHFRARTSAAPLKPG